MVAKNNRVVNEAMPIADARLEDGSRIHIVLEPTAIDGSCITIRKFPKRADDDGTADRNCRHSVRRQPNS